MTLGIDETINGVNLKQLAGAGEMDGPGRIHRKWRGRRNLDAPRNVMPDAGIYLIAVGDALPFNSLR